MNIDALILRQAYLLQYANGYADKMTSVYKSGDAEIIALLRNWYADASEAEKQAFIANNQRYKSVKELTDGIIKIVSKQSRESIAFAETEMVDLAEREAKVAAKVVESDAEVQGSEIIKIAVLGAGVAATWAAINSNWLMRVLSVSRDAVQNDLPPDVAIRGTKEQSRKDGAIYTRNNSIERTAETQALGVSNNAQSEVYKSSGIEQEMWLATLDHRTCPVCGSLDGQKFKEGKGKQPPVHPRCRCLRVPDTGEPEERPFVEDNRPVKDIPKSERAGKIGQTKLTYPEWFKRQTGTAQEQILGKKKYELYENGKLELNEFVNDKTLKIYTLDDLERIYDVSVTQ